MTEIAPTEKHLSDPYVLQLIEALSMQQDRIEELEGALLEICRWGCIAPEDQRATVDVARRALAEQGGTPKTGSEIAANTELEQCPVYPCGLHPHCSCGVMEKGAADRGAG